MRYGTSCLELLKPSRGHPRRYEEQRVARRVTASLRDFLVSRRVDVAAAFGALDTNGGRLDKQEGGKGREPDRHTPCRGELPFTQSCGRQVADLPLASPRRASPRTGDGSISSKEFRQGLDTIGICMTDAQAQDVCTALDADGDGACTLPSAPLPPRGT